MKVNNYSPISKTVEAQCTMHNQCRVCLKYSIIDVALSDANLSTLIFFLFVFELIHVKSDTEYQVDGIDSIDQNGEKIPISSLFGVLLKVIDRCNASCVKNLFLFLIAFRIRNDKLVMTF